MKKSILSTLVVLLLVSGKVLAKDIPQSQVPSVIVNSFQKAFPKAADVEWDIKGELYKVEFETGLLGKDHEVWYNNTGKLVKHKEEIAIADLPSKVSAGIKASFSGYRVADAEKITEGDTITYKVELKSFTKEWKAVLDANGNLLDKKED